MRCVALFQHGPNWKRGRSVYQQGPPIEAHLSTMRQRYEEGSLLLGGPFERGGGIAVLEVADEGAAVDLLAADPAVAAGVLTYTLHPMTAFFDAFASVSTESSVAALARRRTKV
jgi:uncharacterized protein YciI